MFNQFSKQCPSGAWCTPRRPGFRIVFAIIAGFLIFSSQGRPGIILIILIALSALGALYLERWVFDKENNLFEKNVGLLFLHSRNRQPLDQLDKVVLREVGPAYQDRPRMMKAVSRQAAILSIIDGTGTNHGLDMIKGSSLREARDTAQKLATFCDIPFDDLVPQEEAEVASNRPNSLRNNRPNAHPSVHPTRRRAARLIGVPVTSSLSSRQPGSGGDAVQVGLSHPPRPVCRRRTPHRGRRATRRCGSR